MLPLLSFVSSTGTEEAEEHGTNFHATEKLTLQVLHVLYKIIFLISFLISLTFNMFFTLMLVEVKLSGI